MNVATPEKRSVAATPGHLHSHLLRVALKESRRAADCLNGKDPGAKRAPDSRDAVHAKDVKRIIETHSRPVQDEEVREDSGANTKDERAHDVDESGGRGDGNQSCHCAGGDADRAYALGLDVGKDAPRQRGSCRSRIGDEERGLRPVRWPPGRNRR